MPSSRSSNARSGGAPATALSGDAPPEVMEAITWMVNLKSGEVTEREHRAFEAWYEADAAHRRAWNRLAASMARVDRVRAVQSATGDRIGSRLALREMSRRRVMKTLAFGGAAATALGLADRVRPVHEALAEQATWTGERRALTLAGGGSLILGPRSAANLSSDAQTDRIELLAGDLFVALEADGRRSVHITLGDWRLEPTAGRVSLHRDGASRAMVALDAPVRATIGGRRFTIEAAQTLSFEDGALSQRRADGEVAAAWTRGLLILRDGYLAGVVRALQPYFVGLIRISPAAAAIRVAGVFDLNDPRGTLVSLAEGFPITVRAVTPFWLSVDASA